MCWDNIEVLIEKMKTTQIYYTQNHQALIKTYNQAKLPHLHNLFKKYISPNQKILDIGFGSGRDLRYIHSLGADCWGVDSTQGFIDELAKESEFRDRLFYGKLPILDIDFGVKFDVIVCIAVIMHLRVEEIKEWVKDIKNYLANGGKVILSYSITPRVGDDRFFEDLRGGVIDETFIENGFKLVEESYSFDGLNRGIEWKSEVYVLS